MTRTTFRFVHVASTLALFVAHPVLGLAQTDSGLDRPSDEAGAVHSPLGLRRLCGLPAKAGERALDAGAYEVVDLTVPSADRSRGGSINRRGGISYLDIGGGSEWSRRLRMQRRGANYATFTIYVSVGSTISVGGAVLGVARSERDSTYCAVIAGGRAGVDRKPLNHEVPMLPYGGKLMAALDAVTVKVDTTTSLWSVWFRDTLVGDDIPLTPGSSGASGSICVTGGDGGAWVCGLAFADENPLFEDANGNDVPDDFEIQNLGHLLRNDASKEARTAMKRAWLEQRISGPPTEFVLTTPGPDYIPDWCGPNGAPVHGMPNTIRYRPADSN